MENKQSNQEQRILLELVQDNSKLSYLQAEDFVFMREDFKKIKDLLDKGLIVDLGSASFLLDHLDTTSGSHLTTAGFKTLAYDLRMERIRREMRQLRT